MRLRKEEGEKVRGGGEGEGGGGKGKQKGRTTREEELSLLRCALETTEHHYLMLYSAENRDRKPMFHISPLFSSKDFPIF